MSLGKVLERREQGLRSILLYDFVTNRHELLQRHTAFLDRFASESHGLSVTWSVVGMASRLGDQTTRGQDRNRDLSWSRAREVNDYLLRQNMRANGMNPSGLYMPTLNTRVAGVGTRMSDTTSDVNSEFNRGVVIWNNVGIPDFTIEAEVPPAATTHFYIKYLGGGSGGLVASGNYAQFAIRDGRGYWQRYSYGGVHVGAGAPVAWGSGLPPGRGWVSFRTASPTAVDSFSGYAQVGEAGLQAGSAGGSVLVLTFGLGRAPSRNGTPASISVRCPTGSGFSAGGSAGIAAGMIAVGDKEYGRRWRSL